LPNGILAENVTRRCFPAKSHGVLDSILATV